MQHLTNLRFRFNDGDFFKKMAYPEVRADQDSGPIVLLGNAKPTENGAG
jgi:hypothetical protein